MATSVEDQIQALLRSDGDVLAVMTVSGASSSSSRIVTTPLKRTVNSDPELFANEPTPQCFEEDPPYFLYPSVVVGPGRPLSVGGSDVRASRYLVVRYTLAYYAAPDVARVVLWRVRSACIRALHGKRVEFPDGTGARLFPVNDLSGMAGAPEFPGTGMQMIERVSAYGVWRRE